MQGPGYTIPAPKEEETLSLIVVKLYTTQSPRSQEVALAPNFKESQRILRRRKEGRDPHIGIPTLSQVQTPCNSPKAERTADLRPIKVTNTEASSRAQGH